jgi:hypothetical protein
MARQSSIERARMRFVGSMLLLAVVLGASAARAQVDSTQTQGESDNEGVTDRDSLIERGLQLRREHRDSEALEVFRRVIKVFPSPRARAQVALAEQALGQWVAAERDLRDALGATKDPWIKSHKAALEGALEALGKHLGTLVVTTNVTPAEVFLNDTRMGELPMDPLRVPAGPIRIELRSKGYEHSSRTVEVAAQTTVTEEIPLVAESTAAPVASPLPPAVIPAAEAAPVNTSAQKAAPDESMSPAAKTRRVLAWSALGAAGAFLGGAIAAQILSETKTADYNDDSQCLYGDLTRDQRCGVYRGGAESAQRLATFGYVASGVFGVASAVLFFAFPNKPKTSDVTLRFDFDRSRAAIGIAGRL